ncbi:hypothetical protein B0H11DRAFT_1912582 [Mycena galericulata]|nr:hypothetical protein B0H11DRAFT_1912582 [Mycena galericulata]
MSLRLSKHGQTSDIFGTQANSTSEAGKKQGKIVVTRMRDTRNQPKVGDECLWGYGNSKFNSFEASLLSDFCLAAYSVVAFRAEHGFMLVKMKKEKPRKRLYLQKEETCVQPNLVQRRDHEKSHK